MKADVKDVVPALMIASLVSGAVLEPVDVICDDETELRTGEIVEKVPLKNPDVVVISVL